MKSITLIGMPGSGKSSVGKIIAARLGWRFLDTDLSIEQQQGRPLQTLIEEIGEEAFRRLEEETVLALEIPGETVVATGGSVVYSAKAMARVASVSTVVFLDATLEAIRKHVASQAPRGIVGMAEGGLEHLFRERRPRYLQYADLVVRCSTGSAEQVAEETLRLLAEEGR